MTKLELLHLAAEGLRAKLEAVEFEIIAEARAGTGSVKADFIDVSDRRSPAPKKRAKRAAKNPAPNEKPRKKRQMTPEGRARIVAAQRKRWAKVNEASVTE